MKKFYTSRPANFFNAFSKQKELDIQTRFYLGIKMKKGRRRTKRNTQEKNDEYLNSTVIENGELKKLNQSDSKDLTQRERTKMLKKMIINEEKNDKPVKQEI